MHHEFLDKYSDLDSIVHRIDARAKIIGFLVLVGLCVSVPFDEYLRIAGFIITLYAVGLTARIPVLYILRNSAMVLPFALVITVFIPFTGEKSGAYYSLGRFNVGTSQLNLMASIAAKAVTGATAAVVLASSTRFSDMLDGFRRMKFPALIVDVLSFFYRYIFVLIDEVERLQMGLKSRGYRARGLQDVKVIGNIVGVMFLRSYERGERVYLAMKSRLYEGGAVLQGKAKTVPLKDIICILSIALICIGIRFWKIL